MVFEEEINSLDELFNEINILDPDAGLRIETQYRGQDSYIFLTRSGAGYAIAVYSTRQKGKLKVPDQRLTFKHFSTSDEVKDFLKNLLDSAFRCFKY
ncbi:MAG: hypothetical protein QXV32_04880 [Conexivisphaerales archaeon]